MKKSLFVLAALATHAVFGQSLVVGDQSITLKDFKEKYKYGLENTGVDATINSTVEFMLLQQLAKEKKADTITSFRNAVGMRVRDLKETKLIPSAILDPIVANYVKANQNEYRILVFNVIKEEGDTNNYDQIYKDVKAGTTKMEDAILTYVKNPVPATFVKAGTLDNELFGEIEKTPVGSYTKLFSANGSVVFAKVLDKRPSLGYITFGTISYPNDFNTDESKAKIYSALKSGKKFEDVTKELGSTDHERKAGGLVFGSPILPDEVYAQFKGKTKGYYTTEPVKIDNKYFIFNIYNIEPYQLTADNKEFFIREVKNSTYANQVTDEVLKSIMVAPNYKEYADLATIKKSYADFKAFKNQSAPLFQYKTKTEKYSDLKNFIEKNYKDLDKITPKEWSALIDYHIDNSVYSAFAEEFTERPEIKKELDDLRQNLYSQWIFDDYLKAEINKDVAKQKAYYESHKDQYKWEKSAKSRVAIISDSKLVSEVKKEMSDTKKWEALKAKYDKKLSDKNKILVSFEEGKVPATAEVFTEYKVPYEQGIHQTKVKDREVIVAVDELLPEETMTFEEAQDTVKDAMTEAMLQETLANQKKKVKVEIQPGFVEDLKKTFKK
ncbi:peptidyl-prolyl cis-trans isomerase SurA [Soonwooa buanensis]|uniref:Peptidyl-prolyl cis-trans isomerase SurA n=1 Tax=Soonwooa buanensis TaxID=619805 RepID=A0A1T5DNP3_9FLAO|nr:hypothetical protein [Soonwooa buanensis]SKB73314.1 peptidyl-prolyl cis-trans isomerase SurA [Soonwooa buanensis]